MTNYTDGQIEEMASELSDMFSWRLSPDSKGLHNCVPHRHVLKIMEASRMLSSILAERQAAKAGVVTVAWLVVDAKGKKFTIYNRELAEAIRATSEEVGSALKVTSVCELPKAGWFCTRGEGHTGPCASWPTAGGDGRRLTAEDEDIGGWLCAASDDPAVCTEMKLSIKRWMDQFDWNAIAAADGEKK